MELGVKDMPIYEYYCGKCAEKLEVIQKISDKPLEICPRCEHESLKKIASMSAFHLKGGGWFKDGYGKSEAKPAEKLNNNKVTSESNTAKETKKDTSKADTPKTDKTKSAKKSDFQVKAS